ARLGLSPLDCLYEARSHFIEARDLESAVAVTDRIGGPLKWSGLYDELERVNIELLELGSHPSPLCWIGTANFHKRNYERSEEYFGGSLALDSTRDTAAAALHGLGMIDLERGRLEEAKDRFHAAREIQTKVGDAEGEAATWHSLASIALEQGDLENAQHGFSNALNIYRRLRDWAGEVGCLHGLGSVAAESGNVKLARAYYSEAQDLSERFAYPFGKAQSQCDLASLDLRQGRYEKARDRYDEALGIATDIGDKTVEAMAWEGLGSIDRRLGDRLKARQKFQRALTLCRNVGDMFGIANSLEALADLDASENDIDGARAKLLEAVSLREKIGNRRTLSEVLHRLGVTYAGLKQYGEARNMFEKSLKIDLDVDNPTGQAANWHILASLDIGQGDFEAAGDRLCRALKIAQQTKDRPREIAAFWQIGEVARRLGKADAATRLMALSIAIQDSRNPSVVKADLEQLANVANQLSPAPNLEELVREEAAEYQKDRGWSLVRDALSIH
ncbi:MAG: tetratricopeptide repeat protein, partial [Armatimonadota bacterium]